MILRIILLLSLTSRTLADCGCKHLKRGQTEGDRKNAVESCSFESHLEAQMSRKNHIQDMSFIPADKHILGTNQPVFAADRESPERQVIVPGFFLDKFEVSNRDFEEFVRETHYTTEAEAFGDSFVFGGFLDEATKLLYHDFRVLNAEWWYRINGTDWKHPTGPASDIEGQGDSPVVHVSWNDANAFCKWHNKRLPTEDEWEAACRGKKRRRLFPWGDNLMPKQKHWMNIWQGTFPEKNTEDDGFYGTAPVDRFRQNDFDLYNIVGNVWEWVADQWDEAADRGKESPSRVKKGGSYLCHKDYCYRYRCAARSQNSQDSSAGNLGFRCAKSDTGGHREEL